MKTSILTTLTAALLCGCSTITSVNSQLKAKPAQLSSFLTHQSEMKPQRARAPFAQIYVSPALKERKALYTSIYIAPVTTSYLRPARQTRTEKVAGSYNGPRPTSEIASYMKHAFEDAFRYSTNHHLRLAHDPLPGGVTLKLALIELNPTDNAGNAVKGLPGGMLLAGATAGNIAIEGRVTDNTTGEVLFEFADNEQDKISVVSLRDFTPYEHAKVAIREWARHFDELARTPAGHKVEDSMSFTLNPF